ncbi:hypothetical protein HYPSUDRAFT_87122 [Hypholoma sublateritium FD-334 SS-4]|uniref:Mitochondrial import inner membrane translocase subunit n=1 Tax=Hypholoma sublateritium (strain FD-334 SS-4) TaxID=945553 RepID=A0A0D2L7C2_HYPSF|nr:hypothetical protein HYPSUDRAFT_87122 [Hypholoma sublateritium FD-334 SS-4]
MSSFLSSTTGAAPPQDMAARKEAMMNAVRQEMAIQNAQELMNKANERCFAKCVTKPSGSLTSSEETCLSRCLDRYLEAFTMVSKAYTARIGRERDARLASQ